LMGLRIKRKVYQLWKKGQVTQEEYRGLVRLCSEEIRKAKAQIGLRQASVVREKEKFFYKYINNIKWAKESLHPLWDVRWKRKRQRCLMPSLPQSLIVRLVIPRVVSPQCWKIGKESRINLP